MPSYAVTGASRGIGLELVRQISAQSGNTVFAIVRSPSTAENLKKLKESQKNVYIVKADLDDAKSWKVAAEEVAKTTGGSLDVFINNAANTSVFGPNLTKGLDEFPSEDELTNEILVQFKSNTIGAIHATNAFIPLVKKGSVKKVINISSASGDLEFTIKGRMHNMVAYGIAKAALNMVVAKYAAEYTDEGIAFLALCPGMVNTADTATAPPDETTIKYFGEMIEKGRKLEPDWNGQAQTPEAPVKICLDVINNKFTIKDTGAFWSHHGSTNKWL